MIEFFLATAAVAIYDENEVVQYWKEFGEISISYCNRSCNSVAHELARQTLLQKSSQVWVDDPPFINLTTSCKRCNRLCEPTKFGRSFFKKKSFNHIKLHSHIVIQSSPLVQYIMSHLISHKHIVNKRTLVW